MNNNNNINETNNLNTDKRILPLFSTPLILKKINDKKRNKYNFNILNPEKKLTYKIISLNQILEVFLKGITLYKFNLNNFLLNRNKLELILHLKSDDSYKLNLRICNYFYTLAKFFPVFKIKSLLYSVRLFFPKRLFKPEPNIRFSSRLKYISKIYISSIETSKQGGLISQPKGTQLTDLVVPFDSAVMELGPHDKRENKINRRQINKLLLVGKEIINDLDYQINQKKTLIKNIKTNNLLELLNSFFPSVPGAVANKTMNFLSSIPVQDAPQSNNSNVYEDLLKINEKKLIINRIFKSISKSNEIKIEQTMNSILKNNNFDCNTDSISVNSNPVSVIYNQINSNPLTSIAEHSASTASLENGLGNESTALNNRKPILNQYLKSMSIYNKTSNGIFIFYSNIIGYSFNNDTNKLIKNIYNLLAASFKSMYCLISKPVFVITPDKIIIQLFYYLFIPNILKLKKSHKYGNTRRNKLNYATWNKRRKNIKKLYRKFRNIKISVRIKLRKLSNVTITKVFPERFKKLCEILSNLFKKPVELDLIRLHYPYNDSNILVNLLGLMINKIKLRIIMRRLFEKAVVKNLKKITKKTKVNIIPAFLSGMTIRVAGRLLTQRVIPRKTVKTTRRGASAKGKINFSDVARYTNKNKRGAFSITVSSGQNYF